MNHQILGSTSEFLRRSHKHMINGAWTDNQAEAFRDVIDPATGDLLTKIQIAGPTEVDAAVKFARAAFEGGAWSGISAADRGRIMWRWADLLEAKLDVITELEVLDNGMPVAVAQGFIGYGISWIRYFAGMADKIADKNLSGTISSRAAPFHSYTSRQPIGVAGMIIPWNGPFGIFLIKTAPALAAGCSCIVKPAEDTPLTALILAETALEAGIPAGVLNVLTGDGSTGALIAGHPGIDKISFTGSTDTGKKIVESCAKDLKRVTLELGGKSPCIVFDDADLELAIPAAAMAIFSNSGQVCFAGSRLFVHERVYDDVVQGIAEFSKNLQVGNGFDPNTALGPLISQKQLDRVNGYVEQAVKAGLDVVMGANKPSGKGFFVSPTVVNRIDPSQPIAREEVFGPVLAAFPFSDTETLIRNANDTRYGLGAGIFSSNIDRVHGVASALEAGNVWVNHYGGMHPGLPFGGFKESGWGRELGEDGYLAYTEQKTVSIKLNPPS